MAKIKFYFDEMMNRTVAKALVKRGVEVVMANDVGMTSKPDDVHLTEAIKRGMVLVTLDRGFAGLAMKQLDHAGVVCWLGESQDIGAILRALTEFAETQTSESAAGRVFWFK